METQTTGQLKILGDKLHDLFSTKKQSETAAAQPSNQNNPENRRHGETYEQWGTRICGIVTGRLTALPPYLQKVYNAIYNEQAENLELQKAARANTQAEIERKNEEIRVLNDKIGSANQDIDETNRKIEELKTERQEIKASKETVNKEQRLKLIIGLIIIIPLTFYLFLFYSSTFYSAFYRQPETMTDAMNAMFDSKALANASAAGITELGFVLTAPIIFLGLGFSLHFFSVQEGMAKYLKMAAVLLVTAMFDCILAYLIGEQLHNVKVLMHTIPKETYTIKMAVGDVNTWAVIFCGFIVYIIWGVVFDMCMSAYNMMDLNKTRLENIKKEIEDFEQKIKSEKENINELKQQESNAQNSIKTLMAKLGHEVYIDYAAIRTEMNNFFAGWIKMMAVLSLTKDLQDEASEIYKREMSLLIPDR